MEKIADLNDLVRRVGYRMRLVASRCGRVVGIDIPLEFRGGLIKQYLRGDGIEIGALAAPLPMPPGATVKYVDRFPTEELKQHWSSEDNTAIVDIDIVDSAETLATLADNSQDFVIANHVIEHLQNPLAALENFLRVLKPNGIVFMAVPDKRYTFDRRRAITPLPDIIRDYQDGPEWSLEAHYEDWTRYVENVPEAELTERVQQHLQNVSEIHFHVWTRQSFAQLLHYCQSQLGWKFKIEIVRPNAVEFIVILRKGD
jgi:SAM-dependent methyltransferase